MTRHPETARAYAAWHPEHGVSVRSLREDWESVDRKLSQYARDHGWRIIPVDIVPVKENGSDKIAE